MLLIIGAPRNRIVYGLADVIVNECQGGTCISNGGVAGSVDSLASDDGRSRIERPESLGVVDLGIVWFLTSQGVLVDVAERVEWLVGRVLCIGQIGSEQLRALGDIGLGDHVLDWGLDGARLDSVDGPKSKAEKTVTRTGSKLSRKLLSKLDGLSFDGQTTNVDIVGTDITRCGGAVAVGDLPCCIGLLESARLASIEDRV